MSEKLTERQRRFAEELVAGATQEQAAIAAGYSAKTASVIASRLLRDPKISKYRRECAKAVYDRLGLCAEKLALELEEIKQRCMQATPHMVYDKEQKDWVEDGMWMFDPNGAIKAISKQAELMGMEDPTKDKPQRVEIVFGKDVEAYGK